jgi:hypothetical protein
VLVGLLCLVAQVAGTAHLALVSHVRCLEHDALVHGDAGHPEAASASKIDLGVSGVPADDGQHADDHCLVSGLRRREDWAALRSQWRPAVPQAAADAQGLPARRQEPAPSVALLRLAPKASPPGAVGARS